VDKHRDEAVVNRFLHQQARSRLTALAGRCEDTGYNALDRLVQIRIVEDDVRRFSSKLQGHRFETARGELVDSATRCVAASESDVRDVGIRYQRLAGFGAKAGDDVRTPLGKPASAAMRASSSIDTDVNSEGFTTAVHAAASAGASFQLVSVNGEFQA